MFARTADHLSAYPRDVPTFRNRKVGETYHSVMGFAALNPSYVLLPLTQRHNQHLCRGFGPISANFGGGSLRPFHRLRRKRRIERSSQ
jgi:hypothetical protein